jgi:LuxR family maltose regulon positive regulatory protein
LTVLEERAALMAAAVKRVPAQRVGVTASLARHLDATPLGEPAVLLASRFAVPAAPLGFVERPRLVAMVRRGVEGALTLVSAPAGTGKTAAVAAWARSGRAPGPVVWLSLEDLPSSWPVLHSLVADGLRRAGLDVPAGADLALSVVAHDSPVVLVLDHVDDLGRDDAMALHQLVRRCAGALRLVLLSRADPLLPLHRYRLEDSLVEIRMADLAFTDLEARALLAGRGIELSRRASAALLDRTQGWAAGLVLAAMSLAHRSDQDSATAELSGDAGPVGEYLLSEVLDAHSGAARSLLLRTSVVDLLRPGLVEQLAGPQAFRALTFLVRGNAFLEPVPGTPGWLRYHPLFRELLRAQLAYEEPETAVSGHLAAGDWLAREGVLDEAVQHAAAAGDWERAARYVVDALAVGDLLTTGAGGGPGRILAGAPPELHGPAMALVRAALALSRQDTDECRRCLDRARAAVRLEPSPGADLTLAVLTLLRTAAEGAGATAERFAARAEQSLRQLSDDLPRRAQVAAMLHLARGWVLVREGDLVAAGEQFGVAADMSASGPPTSENLRALSLGHLALIAVRGGHLRQARRLAEESLAIGPRSTGSASALAALTAAHVASAWVAAETCEPMLLRRHLEAAAEAPGQPLWVDDQLTRVMLAMVQARVARERGDFAAAAEHLEVGGRHLAAGWLEEALRLELAALDLAAGSPAQAATAANDLLAAAGPTGADAAVLLAHAHLVASAGQDPVDSAPDHPDGETVVVALPASAALAARVDGWLLEAARRLRRGEERGAAQALDRSLRLAAPEQLRRPFREAPSEVRRLLRLHPEISSRHAWLTPSTSASTAGLPGGAASRVLTVTPPVEQLTEKELEVLGHLAELLSTDEIATAMFVSVNTVRTHVRNILRKLSASRRNEAVRRARELGLLPG